MPRSVILPLRPTVFPPAHAHPVEEVFPAGQARVFCTCCNRNVAPPAVRLERAARPAAAVTVHSLCPAGQRLLGVFTAPILAAVASRAA